MKQRLLCFTYRASLSRRCFKKAQLLHFAVEQAPGAGSAAITASVLLIVFDRE
jgi:hypothetical protein